jgi:sugar phosphate isomerase/epimerase
MTLDELLEFSAEVGFKAVDLTAYYFPDYPQAPDKEYVNHIKKKAYLLGLDISGTGVRTDFTNPDPKAVAADIEHVRTWVEVACNLGAPSLRIFAGAEVENREPVVPKVVNAIRECTRLGRRHGVMIVLQNHFDFIKTPDQLFQILSRVDSKWLAVHLDVGSFRSNDPYEEISRVAPYAATWQIKESVYFEDKETKIDLERVAAILRKAQFRGYILVETLGGGDPKVKVQRFHEEVKTALGHT